MTNSPDTRERALHLSRAEAVDIDGAVVAIDVLRAFSTAAYAFAAGARHIILVESVAAALDYKRAHLDVLALGEERGHRPEGFDFSNSPAAIARADLRGRVLVQSTSSGTRGVVAARRATRLWCASLVNASATAAALRASGLGAPAYVLTGRADPSQADAGLDDRATAELIEARRCCSTIDVGAVRARVANSAEATRTRALGARHAEASDIEHCLDVDRFDFAMEVIRRDGCAVLERVPEPAR
ncbi:MAG TPA: 2-phosphosulfolactate phosphatase [Polyangiaceae bacterium]|nr:2-phosphosulfolactate phosphatase [Polyangiaceae bacterium]